MGRFAGVVDLHRLAVEVGVGEVSRRSPEVHQREVVLVRVFDDACTPPEDLLELCHGLDGTVEDDQSARLRIDPRREEPRRRDEDGVRRLWIDEVAELVLSVAVVRGDPHDIPAVCEGEIPVLVDERLPHPRRVFLVDTEEDRFLKLVPALLEVLGDPFRDEFRAVVDDDRPVEILLVIDAVGNLLAIAVRLALLGTVAIDVDIDVDVDDLVRREESVLNTLLEGVRVDGRAEVLDVRGVLVSFGVAVMPICVAEEK